MGHEGPHPPGFHPQMGKVLKTKGAFPNQDACLKLASLGIQIDLSPENGTNKFLVF